MMPDGTRGMMIASVTEDVPKCVLGRMFEVGRHPRGQATLPSIELASQDAPGLCLLRDTKVCSTTGGSPAAGCWRMVW